MNLLSFFGEIVGYQVEVAVKDALAPLPHYLKLLSRGLLFVALGGLALGIALFSVATALFFALAPLPFVTAAIWVAVIFGGIGLLSIALGMATIRPPR